MFIIELFAVSKVRKQFKCPQMDKYNMVFAYIRKLISHKKAEILPFILTWKAFMIVE
jgi:hypothetical protein